MAPVRRNATDAASPPGMAGRGVSAVDHWRSQLEAWRLPDELLDSVDVSPYTWPANLFARIRDRIPPDPVTGPTLRRLLPPGGSLLDVGAGTGRLALPLAAAGFRVTAVEPSPAMRARLIEGARDRAVDLGVVPEPWPESAPTAGRHDVVLSANVVYDVARIGPFLAALHASAAAVVIELTATHPWASLRGYYAALHEIALPAGPTVVDFLAAVDEALGVSVRREDWTAPPTLVFPTRDELLDLFQVRLCVTPDRRDELASVLEPDIVAGPGGFRLGRADRTMTTLMWRVTPVVA